MPAGTYDMILMDIQMPKMNGYKATQTIRHLLDEDKACIPIIAMTANAFTEDRIRGLESPRYYYASSVNELFLVQYGLNLLHQLIVV